MERIVESSRFRIFRIGTVYIYILFLFLFNSYTFSKVYTLNNSDFNEFKQTVNNSLRKDTIILNGGLIKGTGITIEKPITIIGKNNVIIDAEMKSGDLFRIQSDSVTIENLKILNVPKSHTTENAAVKVIKSKFVKLDNIKTENCFFGFYLKETSYSMLSNNSMRGNKQKETSSGNGIHLWKCNNVTISNNSMHFHRDGIYFEFVKNSKILNNYSQNNIRYGLHFMFSDSCTYIGNTFYKNGAGVAVMYSKNVFMKNNTFKENWGTTSYGILLKDIKDSKILHNRFMNNTIGILAEGSNRVLIEENTFNRNGWGLKIMGNCIDNKILSNNFIGNSFDLSTNTMENYNFYEGNYWSNYKGYDLNKDGVGDVPFYPVSLFSVIVQNSPPAMILMHSLFINVLEISEKIFPSLIPKKVIDLKPMMRKIDDKI
ncbi:MAG TPA: nitrous oxide reductase family maturation protein NosD [Candidatus Kapabacteria bacterium]|nr:nitrous oxide reductase family maturation protein NosD [Candidatus Kapabacteria bacterium]